MLHHDTGVLCAPTAFGKTVTAAAIIARRGVNTLVLVHRTELLKQWQERLRTFLGTGKGELGTIGGGKRKPSGEIDIAVMQSLSRKGEIRSGGRALWPHRGGRMPPRRRSVIRCHHEANQGEVRARPDGDADPPRWTTADHLHAVRTDPTHRSETGQRTTRLGSSSALPFFTYRSTVGSRDQDVFRHLANDQARTEAIASEVKAAYEQGRKVLVLTERTEHLDAILAALDGRELAPFALHGRMPRKQRAYLSSSSKHSRQRCHAYCWRPVDSLAKVSTIHRSIPWCWRCRFHGKVRCSNTPDACIASTPPSRTCGSSILRWIPVTQHCCGCGTNGSADTGRWGIGWGQMSARNDDCRLHVREI